MSDETDTLRDELLARVAKAATSTELEEVRVAALGKKGAVTERMKALGTLPPDARRTEGQRLNEVKDAVAAALEARTGELRRAERTARLAAERLDLTLPARPWPQGTIHPITQTIDEIVAIFAEMGFQVAEGPEIESDWNNFTGLNIPEDHPARQMHDTFYLPHRERPGDTVLRTHTSPVQVRTMKTQTPPIRIIVPGRTYRSDYDQTHTPMFHQVEGLLIDETASMATLKGTLEAFVRAFFGVEDLQVRFRPSYFPFTEPSAEVDIGCAWRNGELILGGTESWLEILGSGMVHPRVLDLCGLDPNRWQGFAFGMGIERVAMLKYGIPDLRTFFEADLRWLKHYGFLPLDRPNVALGL